MTCTVLASAVPVDHPRSSARKLNSGPIPTSRPGTPIVTPRASASLASRPSRSVSRLTLGTLPGEPQLAEAGEEEEGQQEKPHRNQLQTRLIKNINHEYVEEVDSNEEVLSGASLTSISEVDYISSSSGPPTPSLINPNFQKEETEAFPLNSTSCIHHLKPASRAVTAASSSYKTRHSKYCNCSSSHQLNEIAMVDAQVIYASSHDPRFPPTAITDGRMDTFWVSGGLYPQNLVLSLPGLTSIDNVNITAYNVRKISVARSIKKQPTDFEEISQEELNQEDGKLQESLILSQNVNAIFLRITIEEAYDHFCAVHGLSVTGSVSNKSNNNAGVPPVIPKVTTEAPSIASSPKKDSTLAIQELPMYQRPQEIEQTASRVRTFNMTPMDETDKETDDIDSLGASPLVEDIGADEVADHVLPVSQGLTVVKAVGEGDDDDNIEEF